MSRVLGLLAGLLLAAAPSWAGISPGTIAAENIRDGTLPVGVIAQTVADGSIGSAALQSGSTYTMEALVAKRIGINTSSPKAPNGIHVNNLGSQAGERSPSFYSTFSNNTLIDADVSAHTGQDLSYVSANGTSANAPWVSIVFGPTTAGPERWFFKSRAGDTSGSVKVEPGDTLGLYHWMCSDGGNYSECAQLEVEVPIGVTTGDNDVAGQIIWKTSPDGGSFPIDAVTITSAQSITVENDIYVKDDLIVDGRATITESLDVAGPITAIESISITTTSPGFQNILQLNGAGEAATSVFGIGFSPGTLNLGIGAQRYYTSGIYAEPSASFTRNNIHIVVSNIPGEGNATLASSVATFRPGGQINLGSLLFRSTFTATGSLVLPGTVNAIGGYTEGGSNTLSNDISGTSALSDALSGTPTIAGSGFVSLGIQSNGDVIAHLMDTAPVSASTSPITSGAVFTHENTPDAHFDHADSLGELNTQIGATIADGPHSSGIGNSISTNTATVVQNISGTTYATRTTVSGSTLTITDVASGSDLRYCIDLSIEQFSVASNFIQGIFMFDGATRNNTIKSEMWIRTHETGGFSQTHTFCATKTNVSSGSHSVSIAMWTAVGNFNVLKGDSGNPVMSITMVEL